MINYCKTGNRIFEDIDCKSWSKFQPELFKSTLKESCSNITNLSHPMCKRFCQNNPGQCPSMPDYCALNPDDPICACINSPLNELTGDGAPPAACFDNECMLHGYQSENMVRVSKNCPTFIDCRQIITAAGSAALDNVNIQQKCSAEIKKAEEEVSKEISKHDATVKDASNKLAGDNPSPETDTLPIDSSNSVVVWLFVMLFMLLVVIALKYVSTSRFLNSGPAVIGLN
jgi:hypothetical protein